MPQQILSFTESDVPADLRAQALALQEQAWPSEPDPQGRVPDQRHDPLLHPVSMLLVTDAPGAADGDAPTVVLAALDILTKQLEHRGHLYTASGLSRVVTDRARRGSGHGRRLVAAAREAMALSGADLGVFTCDRPLQPFYESAGWELLPGTVLVGGTADEPFPSDQFDKVTMASLYSAFARTRAADFHGTRIELFPGGIDRLW
ncbi:GNAT family N-acetyltransferase [Streptacidiphilus sp. EB129]|uniref:GNAT family N-acetyltransferase n=1 Tax=Streptacidiphilus sp. EB129 TaxID=3156262 RepID=UPI003516A109